MFDKTAWRPAQSRLLTDKEAEKATEAIIWLIKKKRVNVRQICSLQVRNIDRESKALYLRTETRHVIYCRKISYQGSPLEEWLEILPSLHNKLFVFPAYACTGRLPAYGAAVRPENITRYLENQQKNLLILLKRYVKIDISTNESHIQKQLMVGRRIALRA